MPTFEPTTDNGRTVAAMYEAFGRGDVPFVMSKLADKVEWIETEATSHANRTRSRRAVRTRLLVAGRQGRAQ